jgi:glucans biosynthesis protein
MLDRRTFLVSAGVSTVLMGLGVRSSALAGSILKFQGKQPFSFDSLINRAQEMAHQFYVAPVGPPNEVLDKIDYDARARIYFETASALFANGPALIPLLFFS